MGSTGRQGRKGIVGITPQQECLAEVSAKNMAIVGGNGRQEPPRSPSLSRGRWKDLIMERRKTVGERRDHDGIQSVANTPAGAEAPF